MGFVQVITTIDSEEKAKEMARALLNNRVAGCVQIIPVSSFYRWKGDVKDEKEWMCLIKGKDFDKIEGVIKEMHTYEVPEIIELPISKGNKDYLDWLGRDLV